MKTTQDSAIEALTIRHTFKAPPSRVFEAWTNPEMLRQFHAPGDIFVADVTVDLRIGGLYRIVMKHPDGEQFIGRRVYREINATHRIVSSTRGVGKVTTIGPAANHSFHSTSTHAPRALNLSSHTNISSLMKAALSTNTDGTASSPNSKHFSDPRPSLYISNRSDFRKALDRSHWDC